LPRDLLCRVCRLDDDEDSVFTFDFCFPRDLEEEDEDEEEEVVVLESRLGVAILSFTFCFFTTFFFCSDLSISSSCEEDTTEGEEEPRLRLLVFAEVGAFVLVSSSCSDPEATFKYIDHERKRQTYNMSKREKHKEHKLTYAIASKREELKTTYVKIFREIGLALTDDGGLKRS